MAFTGYFKTEVNKAARTDGWLWLETTINEAEDYFTHKFGRAGNKHFCRIDSINNIYCHAAEPTEPAGDGTIDTTIFSGSETEYSGAEGYIKSFTSEEDFFTANQDLGRCGASWKIYYNAKYANSTQGYTPYIKFEVYKRDSDDVDTLLFFKELTISIFYSRIGYNAILKPKGTVTTGDRLRIRVKIGEKIPT